MVLLIVLATCSGRALAFLGRMLRLLVPALVSLVALAMGAPSAEACGESGCQALLKTIALEARPTQILPPVLAPVADEAEVRARDRQKLGPATPVFWRQFRSYAYKQLPQHSNHSFKAVWIAMSVRTTSGSVPTLGLKGTWW